MTMKLLNLVILTLLTTVTLSGFTPVSNFDLSMLSGYYNIQSVYDTIGNDWSLAYCFQLYFNPINSTAINMTTSVYDGYTETTEVDNVILYPDANTPAILYQDYLRQDSPMIVVNTSSIPYWVDNVSNAITFAFNYTTNTSNPQYVVLGTSHWYDTEYDITPFLKANNFPINNTNNFWFINTACDTHFRWIFLQNFHRASLEGTWNLLAVYDPVGRNGSNVIPWYTQGGIYDWNQAICATWSFERAQYGVDVMNLTTKSLYGGAFPEIMENCA